MNSKRSRFANKIMECGSSAPAFLSIASADAESGGQDVRQAATLAGGELDSQLDGQQAEKRRELDHRVERHRRRVLERIPDRVADDSGVMQRRAFLLQLHFDDFLGV